MKRDLIRHCEPHGGEAIPIDQAEIASSAYSLLAMTPNERYAMKKILVLHLGDDEETTTASFLGQTIEIHRLGTGGDPDRAGALIAQYDGKVDAIALEGFAAQLKLGTESRVHAIGAALKSATAHTPLVDGSGVRDGLERWAVMLADRAQPGIFAEKIILMTPGLNHAGLIDELNKHSRTIRYADPFVFFNLPDFPAGRQQTNAGASGGPHARSAARRAVSPLASAGRARPTRIDPNRRFIPPIFWPVTSARFDAMRPRCCRTKRSWWSMPPHPIWKTCANAASRSS